MIKKLIVALIIAFIYPPINNINHRGMKTDFHYDFIWNTNQYQLIDYGFWMIEFILILSVYFIINYNENKKSKYQGTQIDEDIYELIAEELEGEIKKSTWTKACELSESNNFDIVKINYIKLRKQELLTEANSSYINNMANKNRINNNVIEGSVSKKSKSSNKFSGFSFMIGCVGFLCGVASGEPGRELLAGLFLGILFYYLAKFYEKIKQ